MKKTVNINANKKDIFYHYLNVTTVLHKLSPKEKHLLSLFLFYADREKHNFKKQEDLWNKVFSHEIKEQIMMDMDIKSSSIHNLMTSLRKKKVIQDNKIAAQYIVNLDDGKLELSFIFHERNL